MNRTAYVTGLTIGAVLFFGPVIRRQNIIWRVACASLGGFAYYAHLQASSESIYDAAVNDVYKKYCIENGMNYHMFD